MTVCLDSWAVIAWLDNENPAAEHVDAVIEQRPVISWLNLAEVYYRTAREHGDARALEVVNQLRFTLDCELPTERRILEAARIKTEHPIAMADCFAISTAADKDCLLFTGDPEIIGAKGLPCEVRDLRA